MKGKFVVHVYFDNHGGEKSEVYFLLAEDKDIAWDKAVRLFGLTDADITFLESGSSTSDNPDIDVNQLSDLNVDITEIIDEIFKD